MSEQDILAALLHNFDPQWCRHKDGSEFGECGARAKALLHAGVRVPTPDTTEATLRAALKATGWWPDLDDEDYGPLAASLRAALQQSAAQHGDRLVRIHGGRHLLDDTREDCPECWAAAGAERQQRPSALDVETQLDITSAEQWLIATGAHGDGAKHVAALLRSLARLTEPDAEGGPE